MKTVLPIRKAFGLPQADLATRLGVCQSSVSAYERGAQEISPTVAKKLVALSIELKRPVTLDQIYGLADLRAEELAAG
jgi:transcriptional regulator with XRE-family HTH domain